MDIEQMSDAEVERLRAFDEKMSQNSIFATRRGDFLEITTKVGDIWTTSLRPLDEWTTFLDATSIFGDD